MKWAIIENNKVKNVISANQDFIDENYPDAIDVTQTPCAPNWSYIDGEFIAPEPVVIDELETE